MFLNASNSSSALTLSLFIFSLSLIIFMSLNYLFMPFEKFYSKITEPYLIPQSSWSL